MKVGGGAERRGEDSGAERRGGVGGAREEGNSKKGEPRRRGGVDGPGVLCDERGGGVGRGFGSAPDHVEGLVPS